MRATLKKGQNVTVISRRENKVIIQDTSILMSGAKITVFECFDGKYETPTIAPRIEELELKLHCHDCIAPDKEFIERYIRVAIRSREKSLVKINKKLQRYPNLKRYKKQLECCKDEIKVIDLRGERGEK